MAEYIDRDELIKHLEDELEACGESDINARPIAYGTILGLKGALSYARTLPTADVVEVVRCKIGDTVYQTDGVRIYELEILDVSLRRNKPYYETESIDFDGDAIGKTVFLTRAEAERELERRKK